MDRTWDSSGSVDWLWKNWEKFLKDFSWSVKRDKGGKGNPEVDIIEEDLDEENNYDKVG